jgi:protein-S-isoprenylcysteine O-methyltransferase Ste14
VEYLSPFDEPFSQADTEYIPESEFIVDFLRVSPQLILGTTMAVIGGLTRWACYKAMKELFTFQLSVRKGHRLVTWGESTSIYIFDAWANLIVQGPYAYVRHPSYTGALLAGSGTILSLVVGRGSWVRECLWTFLSRFIWPSQWRAPGNTTTTSLSWEIESFDPGPTLVVLALTLLLARVAFVPRMKKEDEMMEREFGQEWRQWRTRVRWKMVPWIY